MFHSLKQNLLRRIIIVTGHLNKRHGKPGVPIDVEVDGVDGVAASRDRRLLRRDGDGDIVGVDVCVSLEGWVVLDMEGQTKEATETYQQEHPSEHTSS